MRALIRCLIAAVWGIIFLFLGGYIIRMGTTRHGNYEYYGTYVLVSWFIAVAGVIAILSLRRRHKN